jgi:quinoprotein glucose dehydrogenase
VVSKADGPLATLARGPTNGGSNWPGGAFDPETHTFYVASSNAAAVVLGLVQPSKDRSDMDWVAGSAAAAGRRWTRRRRTAVQGLSIFKPPYGTITAINLDKGEIAWQVPHGETPERCGTTKRSKASTFRARARPDSPSERSSRRHSSSPATRK